MVCNKCGESAVDKFYKTNKKYCKVCTSARSNERYHSLKSEDKAAYRERSRLWQTNNIFQQRFLAARSRARAKGIDFNITKDYIVELYEKQGGKCFYSGIPLSKRLNDRHVLSIDRVDSDKGYVADNVVISCAIVNSMKNDMTKDEFTSIIESIYQNQRK